MPMSLPCQVHWARTVLLLRKLQAIYQTDVIYLPSCNMLLGLSIDKRALTSAYASVGTAKLYPSSIRFDSPDSYHTLCKLS